MQNFSYLMVIPALLLKHCFDYTFNMAHRRSGIISGSGKTIAIDGLRAAPEFTEDMVKCIEEARLVQRISKPKEVAL